MVDIKVKVNSFDFRTYEIKRYKENIYIRIMLANKSSFYRRKLLISISLEKSESVEVLSIE